MGNALGMSEWQLRGQRALEEQAKVVAVDWTMAQLFSTLAAQALKNTTNQASFHTN